MQGDWIVGLDKLPVFKDGYPLGAESLRRIGYAQDYLSQRYGRYVPAQPIMQLETPAALNAPDTTKRSMYMIHRHRYLIWKFRQDVSLSGRVFRMKINGKRAFDLDSGSSPQNISGVIDLNGNDLDGNPYNLPVGRAYEIEWSTVSGSLSGVYGMVFAYDTYECATSNSTLSLPVANPTFGGTPTAAQFNNLVTNCNFLLEQNGIADTPGYIYHTIHIPAPGGLAVDTSYQPHHHKYLAVRYDIDMGFYSNDITSTVYVNGSSIYADTKSKVGEGGGVIHNYKLFLDVSGLGLAAGSAYKVEVKANKSQWDDLTSLIVHYVGESPLNAVPDW